MYQQWIWLTYIRPTPELEVAIKPKYSYSVTCAKSHLIRQVTLYKYASQ